MLAILALTVLLLPPPERDLASLVDPIFADVDRRDTPGCAVAITDRGRLVFAKGYGMANLEHGLPIAPDTPRMRVSGASSGIHLRTSSSSESFPSSASSAIVAAVKLFDSDAICIVQPPERWSRTGELTFENAHGDWIVFEGDGSAFSIGRPRARDLRFVRVK